MQQLRPGLWTWTAGHPGWTEDEGGPEGWDRLVRSYAYDSGPCLVLIDPLAPPSLLEGLVESKDVEAVPKLSLPAQAFEQGDTLPGGVVAQIECYPFEAIFWIPAERAIVAGDALVGGELGLHVQPESWHVEGTTPESFRDRLRPLLDLPIELVLLTHGDPVLEDGREAVRAALDT